VAFTERLRVVIDVVTGNANKGLSDFRSSIAQADGFAGKLKAGTKVLGDSLKSFASSPAAAGAAVSALAAFAADATGEFMNLAKQSRDFAEATGLSTEQASQWIEIAGDYGIEAGTLESLIGKLNRTMDPAIAQQYGIALTDSSGQARSANDIFIDVLALLGRTKDAGERARTAAKLLGRGWQDVAPILGKTRSEYEAMLGSVSEGQTITDTEYRSSQKLRESLQDLSDSWTNVKMKVGEAVASNSSVIDLFSKLIDKGTQFRDWQKSLGDMGVPFRLFTGDISAVGDQFQKVSDLWNGWFGDDPGKGARDVAADFATIGNRETVTSINTLRDAVGEVGEKAYFTAGGIKDVSEEFATLLGQIDQRSQLRNLMDDFDNVESAAKEYYDAAATGAEDVEQKQRAYEQAIDDSKVAVIEYADEIGGIPPAAVTNIIAQIDQGSIDNARRLLASLGDLRITYYGRINEQGIPQRALGGPVSKDSMYQVGEGGKPELLTDAQGRTYLIPGTNGVVTPIGGTGSTGSAGGNTFNITITKPMVSGEQLANELKKYISRNGSAWLS
jgi:soluble cytochrome b562